MVDLDELFLDDVAKGEEDAGEDNKADSHALLQARFGGRGEAQKLDGLVLVADLDVAAAAGFNIVSSLCVSVAGAAEGTRVAFSFEFFSTLIHNGNVKERFLCVLVSK